MSFFVALLVVALGAKILTKATEWRARAEVWKLFAMRKGGVYFPARGLLPRLPAAAEVPVDEVRVHLDTYVERAGGARDQYTRAQACYMLPAGPRFIVYRQGVWASIGKLLGGADVVLGIDREFDDLFIVKCDDPEATRAVWSRPLARIMVGALADARVTSDRHCVTLHVPGVLKSPETLQLAVDVVSALVEADLFGIHVLRSLPGAIYHPPTGPWHQRTAAYVLVGEPTPVRIGPEMLGKRAVTVARSPLGFGGPPLTVRFAPDEPLDLANPDGAAKLPPQAPALIRRIGSGKLTVSSQESELLWNEIVHDPEQLRAGVELLTLLCRAPSAGVYR